ncbi:SDR family oxidoreductase [Croceitalea rosinachiae]|uniref:SDR family oxidoreductase n=1 Tax=Croceitalea rosinachiae TaxID=3075596 RepID=A0ABU3AA51_9FLAO|nr:SDR family oxidoreductase [Croceitalea sp. F388]MDT0607060.1 SDR family oxidoreductase [Croceitalea sp. F388]
MLLKTNNKRILLAGGTGYLGGHIAKAIQERGLSARLLSRKQEKLKQYESSKIQIMEATVTEPNTLSRSCDGIDTVISTIGITRQKDGFTYMDVDYQANLNLLREAQRAGVRKLIYVSAINGDKHRDLKIFEAKEAFVDELKKSGLEYTVIRPNGFFSDMKDFFQMARKGRVFLFGSGEQLMNPIHGADLAEIILNMIDEPANECSVGGPDVLTQNEIAELAFDAQGRAPNIWHLPDWVRRFSLWSVRTFTSVETYGPIEFFLTLMANDNVAMRYGTHKLRDFYFAEAKTN